MENELDIPQFINKLETDYKAEAIATALLNYYDTVEAIHIKRLGNKGRAKKKDIAKVRKNYFDVERDRLLIETNRESIYDYLPEGLFHRPTLGSTNKTTSEIVAAIREQKQKEKESRLFFEPFEIETFYVEIAALCIEQQLDNKGIHDDLLLVIEDLWPLLKQLDKADAQTFIYFLPFFYMTTGNKKWFSKMLQSFLGYSVVITDVPNRESVDTLKEQMKTQKRKLGVNSVLCGSHFDGNMNWKITIGPVEYDEATKFLPGSKLSLLLQSIYESFVPECTLVIQKLIINRHKCRIGKNNATNGHLGYNLYL